MFLGVAGSAAAAPPAEHATVAAANSAAPGRIRQERLVQEKQPASSLPRTPHWLRVAETYGLVPRFDPGPVTFGGRMEPDGRRILHEAGDPDSLFSLGGTEAGRFRVGAAIEINDVIPRLVAPEPESARAGDRPRVTGNYQSVDRLGNPRQLRVGARLKW